MPATSAVLATRGNLNNDIGVPLTLLRPARRAPLLRDRDRHEPPGEIAYLAGIARPTVALVNNAQREHLEFMRSVEAVARENGEVYDALPADGVAVVNADDAHAGFFREPRRRAPRRSTSASSAGAVTGRYALHAPVERDRRAHARGDARCDARGPRRAQRAQRARRARPARTPLASRRRRSAQGLTRVPPVHRPPAGQAARAGGATLIDDTYNANPDSVRAAIDVLAACPAPTRARARRHGRGRRAAAGNSTPRSARTRASRASTRCSRWARRRAHAVAGVRRGRAPFRRASRSWCRRDRRRRHDPGEGLALHADGARRRRADAAPPREGTDAARARPMARARTCALFNVFNYITLRAVLACLTALAISLILGPVRDPQAHRVQDRPGGARRRPAVAPDQGRHADHGRRADPGVDRGHDAAVGRSDEPLHVGGAAGDARPSASSAGSTTTARSCTAIRRGCRRGEVLLAVGDRPRRRALPRLRCRSPCRR